VHDATYPNQLIDNTVYEEKYSHGNFNLTPIHEFFEMTYLYTFASSIIVFLNSTVQSLGAVLSIAFAIVLNSMMKR
ncbi:MAG: hypothetical protein OEZ01_13640, partial [Candidatus Heimdallarchaeota archaeon]|nr:hypothetical protein [Candidatus Heimdallarchaeota archaeon]